MSFQSNAWDIVRLYGVYCACLWFEVELVVCVRLNPRVHLCAGSSSPENVKFANTPSSSRKQLIELSTAGTSGPCW